MNNNTPITANILIVDDELNIRQGLKMFLKRDGHNIFTAGDGIEAPEKRQHQGVEFFHIDRLYRVSIVDYHIFQRQNYTLLLYNVRVAQLKMFTRGTQTFARHGYKRL